MYHHYVFPDNIRPKISQMLLLPPFQKMGLGVELLSTVYKRYRPDPKVVDIPGNMIQFIVTMAYYYLIFSPMFSLISSGGPF